MKQIFEELSRRGCETYLVGGAVRDNFLRLPIKDFDYVVTNIKIDDLVEVLTRFGAKVDLVGKSFGVLKVAYRGQTLDIALPRTEYSTGAGHKDFAVEYSSDIPIEDDLKRRDFTINSVAFNVMTQKYIDVCSGIDDIKKGKIRVTYADSFKDDPLRMLRAIQFASRLNFRIDSSTLQQIKDNKRLIQTVPAERIQEELNKLLLKSITPSIGIELMRETGLLFYVMPELELGYKVEQEKKYHSFDVYWHNLYACDYAPADIVLKLAALLHDIGKPESLRFISCTKCSRTPHGGVDLNDGDRRTFHSHELISGNMAHEILTRLKYSNEIVGKVVHLIKQHMFDDNLVHAKASAIRRLIKRIGKENIEDMFKLRECDRFGKHRFYKEGRDFTTLKSRVNEEINAKHPFGTQDLAINGTDIMQIAGLKQGKEIGDILQYLLEIVLEEPEHNNFDDLKCFVLKYKEENGG